MQNKTNRSKKKFLKWTGVIIIISILLLIGWHCRPMSEDRLSSSYVTVKVTEWKEIITNEKVIERYDSCEIYGMGQWIDRFYFIPSCFGSIKLLFNGEEKHKWLSPDDHALYSVYFNDSTVNTNKYINKLSEISYYLRVNDVLDEGYNQIANYNKYANGLSKKLQRIISSRENIKASGEKISIKTNRSYTVYYKNKDGKIESINCNAPDNDEGIAKIIQAENLHTPFSAHAVPKILQKDIKRSKTYKLLVNSVIGEYRDNNGIYAGEIGEDGLRNGYGKYTQNNGDYYEGFWKNGKRNGWGFSSQYNRFRAGEWNNDIYKGEKMQYNNSRIYGIDISRFQHKSYFIKVRKTIITRRRKRVSHSFRKIKRSIWVNKEMHHSIEWNKMYITSLGSLSKKRIQGEVGYKVSFVYIKSTEGTSLLNPFYHLDYVSARAHHIYTGTYHFFSTRTTGKAQAKYFLEHSHYKKGDFPPVLDVEPYPSQIKEMGGAKQLFANMRSWLYTVEHVWGVRPILYISQTFVNKYLPEAPDIQSNYEVWIARYGEYKPDVHLIYWQLCPDGRVAGIKGHVDINVFNGYGSVFKKFISNRNINSSAE